MNMNQMSPLSGGAIAVEVSEYHRWSQELEHSLEALKEALIQLHTKLEPVRCGDPRLEKPDQSIPESPPLSPVNEFIRTQSIKVHAAHHAVRILLREVQL